MRGVNECVNSWLRLLPRVCKEPQLNMLLNVWPHTIIFFSRAWKREEKMGEKGKKEHLNQMRHLSHSFCWGSSPSTFWRRASICKHHLRDMTVTMSVRQYLPDTLCACYRRHWQLGYLWLCWWWRMNTEVLLKSLTKQSHHRNSEIGLFFSLFSPSTEGQSDLCRLNQKSQGFMTILKCFL